jgi:hypothetical protein
MYPPQSSHEFILSLSKERLASNALLLIRKFPYVSGFMLDIQNRRWIYEPAIQWITGKPNPRAPFYPNPAVPEMGKFGGPFFCCVMSKSPPIHLSMFFTQIWSYRIWVNPCILGVQVDKG